MPVSPVSIASRTALDPLFRSSASIRCHISCPAPGSTGQFSQPKFFQTSAILSRPPPMDLYGNDSIPNYSLILHVSSFVFQKTHFFVPIQLLSNYLQRDFSIPLNERRACVESHGTNVISLRYRGRKGWNEWRRQRFGNARRHAREITGRFTRELLA